MRRAAVILAAGLAAAGLAVAGCSHDGGGSGGTTQAQAAGQSTGDGAKSLDPCTLPSKADLKAVLGADPLGPDADDGVSLKQCSWFDTSGDRYAVVQLLNPVNPGITDPDGYGWTRDGFDDRWKDGATPVDGLGDAAWYAEEDDGATLFVLRGQFGYSVGLVYMTAKDRPAQAQLLGALKPFAAAIGAKG